MKSLFASVLIFLSFSVVAKDPNKRGLFIDKFIVYYDHINWVVDSANSILGNPVREDSLLDYCLHNHIEYICLYDLYPAIAGHVTLHNTTYRGYLSCFIENAKTNYCIEQVGAAGEVTGFFQDVDDQYTLVQSPGYELEDEFVNHESYNPILHLVESEYDLGTPEALASEMMKFNLRIRDYNILAATNGHGSGCNGEIDVLTLEQEFWNAVCDPCDTAHSDAFWNLHLPVLAAMASIRDINNSDPTNNPLITEDYIGKFHKDTIADSIQVDALDALVDRILLTFYVGWYSGASYDYPSHFFSAINQQWQENRLVQLGQNNKQTIIWPMFEASWILPGRPFLGNWLKDSLSQGNNYLKAE